MSGFWSDLIQIAAALLGCFLGVTLANCPEECNCGNLKVDCSSRELQTVPHFSLDLQKTVYVDLRTNSIEKLTMKSFTNLFNVQTLILQFNVLTDIEEGTFSNMLSLKTLDLSGNQFKVLPRDVFKPLTNLHSLDLSQNYLHNLDGAFSSLKNLYRLDLGHNSLDTLTDLIFTDLQGLMYLMMGNNRITTISKNAFSPMKKLSYLVLKNNPLYNVDHKFVNNRRMSYTDLTNCKLQTIPKGLPWVLRYLQLTQNNITSITRESMKGYNYVAVVVLDQNVIHYVEPGAFSHMTYLRQLWMNGNELSTVPERLPINLQFLYLDSNEITFLHENIFPKRSQLLTFSVKGNQIQHVSAKHFDKMPQITKLYLDNNNLTQIEDFTFKSLGKLEHLFISRNPLLKLTRYSLFGLRQLQYLEMAFIITDVDMDEMIFSKTPKLSKLELQYSTELAKTICNSHAILKTVSNLTELNLMSTELSTLNPMLKDELPLLKQLQLADNKWHCDKSLLWLNHWMRMAKTLFVNKMDVRCFSPRSLHGKAISSMFDSQFVPITTTPTPTTTPATTTEMLYTSTLLPETTTSSLASTRLTTKQTSPLTTPEMPTTMVLTTPEMITTMMSTATPPVTTAIPVTTETKTFTPKAQQTSHPTTSQDVPRVTMATQGSDRTREPSLPTEIPTTHQRKSSSSQTPSESKTALSTVPATTAKTLITTTFSQFTVTSTMSQTDTPMSKGNTTFDTVSKVFKTTTAVVDQSASTRDVNTTNVREDSADVTSSDHSGQTTAIATSITVIILILILIAIGIFVFRYRKNRIIYHRAIHYKQHSDMMYFITVSESETKPIKGPGRSERGSVSSVPSEDITNEEGGIKVYHWDGEN